MVIYFNNWFSSISGIIADIKERDKTHSLKIIGSSHNPNHVMRDVVDEFYVEDGTGETEGDFIKWVIPFLKEHKVDVFFVKKWAEQVLEHKEEIEALGTTVVLDDKWIYEITEDKSRTYDFLRNRTFVAIPEYLRTDNKNEVVRFLINNPNACLKLNNGEGGMSYKKISNRITSMNDLEAGRYNHVTHEEIFDIIGRSYPEEINRFIFMEYLESPEISVDCYNSYNGFLAVCRSKIGITRAERIFYNKEISDTCLNICNAFGFKYPFNVQFRKKAGTPDCNFILNYRLLEINPRISGGSYYQTAIGLNICNVCLYDVLNRRLLKNGNEPQFKYDINDYIEFEEKTLSYVEKAVLIN